MRRWLNVRLQAGWTGLANYAYLDNRDATNVLERTQWSRHSGALGLSRDFGSGWQGALAYVGQSGDGFQQSAYGRTTVTVSRVWTADQLRWRAALGVQHFNSPETTYGIGSPEPLQSRYSSRIAVQVRLSVTVP